MRFLRSLVLVIVGFWAGIFTSARILKRILRSRGDASSDEVALVAIFDGIKLESRSGAFRGGSMLAWYGGIAVDLRSAELAPDAHLTVHALWGGIAIKVPPEWHVESTAHAPIGGISIGVPPQEHPDAPRLTIDGFALFGGISVGAEAAAVAPES